MRGIYVVVILCFGFLGASTCQGLREVRDTVATQGKSVTEAIDRNTNRCRPYTPLFP